MSNLPLDIIGDILSRLPVKSLLRFKCVSKKWRLLIDSEHFIKSHLNRSIQTRSNRTVIVAESTYHESAFDMYSFNSVDLGNYQFDSHMIVDTCNGIVLVSSNSHVFLWNPFTRKLKNLPQTEVDHPQWSPITGRKTYRMGYDSENDDYKVVKVADVYNLNGSEWLCSETKVYSLRSNSFKRVGNFPYTMSGKVRGVHVNGTLNTLVKDCPQFGSGKLIMGFDLVKAEHYVVPQMELKDKHLFKLDELEGRLAALVFCDLNGNEIWVMKEYGVKESWTILLTLELGMPRMLYPLAYSKKGDKVLLQYDERKYIWYDLEKKCGSFESVEHLPLIRSSFVCVESLVSLDNPSGVKRIDSRGDLVEKKGKKTKKNRCWRKYVSRCRTYECL